MAKSKRRQANLIGLSMLVLAGLFLASCGGSGEPTEYNQAVEDNYVQGCEGSIDESELLSGDAMAVCQCTYDLIEENIDFEDFRRIDDALWENIDALDGVGANTAISDVGSGEIAESEFPKLDAVISEISGYVRTCGEPTEYNQAVEDNYVQSCETSIDESDLLSGDAMAVCQCTYDLIEENIDFEDFRRIDDALGENIDALDRAGANATISEISGYVRGCLTRTFS